MAEITRERREEMRRAADGLHDYLYVDSIVPVTLGELRALLDAADERDRLREAAPWDLDRLVENLDSRRKAAAREGDIKVKLLPFELRTLLNIARAFLPESTDAPL